VKFIEVGYNPHLQINELFYVHEICEMVRLKPKI
jgi:hypothetical protein